MASNFGYYNVLRKKTNLNVCFIPLVTISVQFVILYLAGILNMLLLTAIAMLLVGVILFAMDICQKRYSEYRSFGKNTYLYMGICAVFLLLTLHGSKFCNFDDFSHWATIVQELLMHNAYPNYASSMILFQSYPLGSATYIYYCCLLAGTEESTMMLVQAFMMVCAIMPLFSCVKKHPFSGLVCLLCFTYFAFTYVYNIYLTSLMVDTLLPLFSMAAFLIVSDICRESRKSENTDGKTDLWVAAPLLAMTVMLKNSGVFFAVPTIIALMINWKRRPEQRLLCAAGILSPAACMVIWKRHCSYVFMDAASSKHSVSLGHYAEEFLAKSAEMRGNIGRAILYYTAEHPALICIVVFLLLIVGIHILIYKTEIKKSLYFSGMVLAMYVLYTVGLYGMYVFSMPMEETFYLAEFDRYMGSMDIAAFYLLMSYGLRMLDAVESKLKFKAAFAAMLGVVLLLWGGLTQWRTISGNHDLMPRKWFEDQIQQYNIPLGASCVICSSVDEADGYMGNVMRYLLWSNVIYAEDDFDAENRDQLHNFSYIMMFDYEDEEMNQWIRDNYPDQYGNAVIITSAG